MKMKSLPWIPSALILFMILSVMRRNREAHANSDLTYLGHPVRTSKPYDDYDDYKEDPNNLAPGQAAEAGEWVRSAPIAKQFQDRKQMIDAVFTLKFPGYGLGSYGETSQPDGSVLDLHGLELPQSGNSRFLLYRGVGSVYTCVDDFVHADEIEKVSINGTGDQFIYSTRMGTKILERNAWDVR